MAMSRLQGIMLSAVLLLTLSSLLLQADTSNLSAPMPAGVSPGAPTITLAGDATPAALRKLLLQRKEILDRMAESIRRWVEAGRSEAAEYAEARQAALLAGLDLCETRTERIEIRREILQWHVKAEAWAQQRVASGRATEMDLDKIRVTRLEAEIELLKEQLAE
jgi:hypothetical protein